MRREHSPRPGAAWAQEPVRVELVVEEETGKPAGLNREQRRALERAKRKGGKR